MSANYYWIVAKADDGAPILIFGDRSEMAARQKGLEQLSGIDFRLVPLPTTNLQRASALIRGKSLEETHDLKTATRRQVHERGLRRKKQQAENWGFPNVTL